MWLDLKLKKYCKDVNAEQFLLNEMKLLLFFFFIRYRHCNYCREANGEKKKKISTRRNMKCIMN